MSKFFGRTQNRTSKLIIAMVVGISFFATTERAKADYMSVGLEYAEYAYYFAQAASNECGDTAYYGGYAAEFAGYGFAFAYYAAAFESDGDLYDEYSYGAYAAELLYYSYLYAMDGFNETGDYNLYITALCSYYAAVYIEAAISPSSS